MAVVQHGDAANAEVAHAKARAQVLLQLLGIRPRDLPPPPRGLKACGGRGLSWWRVPPECVVRKEEDRRKRCVLVRALSPVCLAHLWGWHLVLRPGAAPASVQAVRRRHALKLLLHGHVVLRAPVLRRHPPGGRSQSAQNPSSDFLLLKQSLHLSLAQSPRAPSRSHKNVDSLIRHAGRGALAATALPNPLFMAT